MLKCPDTNKGFSDMSAFLVTLEADTVKIDDAGVVTFYDEDGDVVAEAQSIISLHPATVEDDDAE